LGKYLSSGQDFASAHAAGNLPVFKVDARRLLRLTRFPQTEPYWGKNKAYRFDDPAQVYGATYTALRIEVAFAETILHQRALYTGKQWVIDEANIVERHVVTYTRPARPNLLVADFTGANLKALGLNNDLCSSDDYTDSMAVSSALHAQIPELDGIMYVSRQMNTGLAVALFERSKVELESKVIRLTDHPDYDDLLGMFNVAILPRGRAHP
jgi:hypothetical protein